VAVDTPAIRATSSILVIGPLREERGGGRLDPGR
jgi:hypothetical protein